MASPSASEMSPRCSIVRYAMHRRASSAYGPTNAWVAHAPRHAVQVPHRSGSRAPHSSSAVLAPMREVVHRPRVAGREPALEGGAVLGLTGRPDGHAVEPELARPRLDRPRERQADERHALRALTTRRARVSVRPPSSRNFT